MYGMVFSDLFLVIFIPLLSLSFSSDYLTFFRTELHRLCVGFVFFSAFQTRKRGVSDSVYLGLFTAWAVNPEGFNIHITPATPLQILGLDFLFGKIFPFLTDSLTGVGSGVGHFAFLS